MPCLEAPEYNRWPPPPPTHAAAALNLYSLPMTEPQRPLRVLHLTSASSSGGVSRYLYDLCRKMHERGHQVAIAGGRGDWHDLFDTAPWPWIEAPINGSPRDMLRGYRILRRYLRDHPVDILHSHYRKPMLVARALSRGTSAVPISTLHLTGVPMRGIRRWFTDFGRHVHTPSQQAREWLISDAGVRPDMITVIPHGIDTEKFPVANEQDQLAARAALDLPAGATIAAYAGRFGPQKNPHWLLDLAETTRDALPNLVVVLMGNGSLESELRQRLVDQNLSDRARILSYNDPLPLYQAADAILLPSSFEGFALMTAEAMSVGRPVMRTDTAGWQEQIEPGKTGEVVPVDREKFLSAATGMLANRQKLRQMGAAAAARVRQHLTLAGQVEQTERLYRLLQP